MASTHIQSHFICALSPSRDRMRALADGISGSATERVTNIEGDLTIEPSASTIITTKVPPSETKGFRFMDLPPEIRDLIYKEVLVAKDRRNIWIAVKRRKPMRMQGSVKTYFDGYSLLAVNRTIHAEAAPILYSLNGFEFGRGYHLELWLKLIGGNRIFLREIVEYDFDGKGQSRKVARYLTQATNLQAFKLAWICWRPNPQLSRLAEDFRDFFSMLNEREGDREKAFNVVCSDIPGCYCAQLPENEVCECKEYRQRAQDNMEILKQLVYEYIDDEPADSGRNRRKPHVSQVAKLAKRSREKLSSATKRGCAR